MSNMVYAIILAYKSLKINLICSILTELIGFYNITLIIPEMFVNKHAVDNDHYDQIPVKNATSLYPQG